MTHDVFNPREPRNLTPQSLRDRRAHLLREIGEAGTRMRNRSVHTTMGWPSFGSKRGRRAVVPMFAVIVLLGIVGTAIAVNAIRTPGEGPRLMGERVEIASEPNWTMTAWKSDFGICIDLTIDGNDGTACGLPVVGAPPDTAHPTKESNSHAISYVAVGGSEENAAVAGPIAERVARVQLERHDGRVLSASIYDAPPALETRLRFFALVFNVGSFDRKSRRPFRSLSAYDASGALIERLTR